MIFTCAVLQGKLATFLKERQVLLQESKTRSRRIVFLSSEAVEGADQTCEDLIGDKGLWGPVALLLGRI